ncbi:MAG: nicotinate (nicotinamide) nucleotide adenylyltransferase [Flavobacteriales bacterium]|nr:nicotinate (nicotinamide) nucleotide adenylyltransferase [Flavobacteriales bacterium]
MKPPSTSHKKIGLYFGTFNPIHMGHLVIANHMATQTDLDEVWLVVTPRSPQKNPGDLMDQDHRLQMVHLALAENEKLSGSDVEFDLPLPNYTAATMRHLRSIHPNGEFSIIIGEDNFHQLHTWKDHWELVEHHRILVYPRRSLELEGMVSEMIDSDKKIPADHPHVIWCDAPMISISSTYLRHVIQEHKDIRYLLPDTVLNYISNNHLYE